jgi:hypothetical protein
VIVRHHQSPSHRCKFCFHPHCRSLLIDRWPSRELCVYDALQTFSSSACQDRWTLLHIRHTSIPRPYFKGSVLWGLRRSLCVLDGSVETMLHPVSVKYETRAGACIAWYQADNLLHSRVNRREEKEPNE